MQKKNIVLSSINPCDAESLASVVVTRGFCIEIELEIGFSKFDPDIGSNLYTVNVCDQYFIEAQIESSGYFIANHHIVVSHFDHPAVESAIRSIVESCEHPDQIICEERLAIAFHSEFFR